MPPFFSKSHSIKHVTQGFPTQMVTCYFHIDLEQKSSKDPYPINPRLAYRVLLDSEQDINKKIQSMERETSFFLSPNKTLFVDK